MKVELIDHMGADESVVNAARVSFDKQAGGYSDAQNARLIHYLARHNHWTPFGHCFASFRIKAPLFVARQLGKHQVGLVWNESSRRYVDSEPEFYTPGTWRARADNVKQGSSDEAAYWDGWFWDFKDDDMSLEQYYELSLKLYNRMLLEEVCPEQARMVLPQSMMTEWVWSGSLAAFARVCKLRLDPHTQYETRVVAEQIATHMKDLFPVSWNALLGASHE